MRLVSPIDSTGRQEGCTEERSRCPDTVLLLEVGFHHSAGLARAVARKHSLSRRETEVLVVASTGACTKEVADQLGLSRKSVEYFWSRIYAKLHCRSQIEVMALLLRTAVHALHGTSDRDDSLGGRAADAHPPENFNAGRKE